MNSASTAESMSALMARDLRALGRCVLSPGLLLETADSPDPDKTWRPAEHLDLMRTIVARELPSEFDRQVLFESQV